MPGLDSDIVQHKLPLNPGSSPVKQKLQRMKPEMSLKIKEEVRKQFDAGFLVVARLVMVKRERNEKEKEEKKNFHGFCYLNYYY